MVNMCLFHTREATLGDQYGGGPAISNKKPTERGREMGLASRRALFLVISFMHSSLGFSHFPPVHVVSGLFSPMSPRAQVCSFSRFLEGGHSWFCPFLATLAAV